MYGFPYGDCEVYDDYDDDDYEKYDYCGKYEYNNNTIDKNYGDDANNQYDYDDDDENNDYDDDDDDDNDYLIILIKNIITMLITMKQRTSQQWFE